MKMQEYFHLFEHIRGGDIKGVVRWMTQCETGEISCVAEGSIARVELCHQSERNLKALTKELCTLLEYKGLPTADIHHIHEKEKWIALYYLKAYSVYDDKFDGVLDMLRVRPVVVKKRLSRFCAQAVIEAEERYCQACVDLISRQALSWFEYMSCSYMDRLLVTEVSRYLMTDTPDIRRIQYVQALGRMLTAAERDIMHESAMQRARNVADWVDNVCQYGSDACTYLDEGLMMYFDCLIRADIPKEEAEKYAKIAYDAWAEK